MIVLGSGAEGRDAGFADLEQHSGGRPVLAQKRSPKRWVARASEGEHGLGRSIARDADLERRQPGQGKIGLEPLRGCRTISMAAKGGVEVDQRGVLAETACESRGGIQKDQYERTQSADGERRSEPVSRQRFHRRCLGPETFRSPRSRKGEPCPESNPTLSFLSSVKGAAFARL